MDNEGLVVSSDGTEPAETTVEAGKITVSANPTSGSENTITIDANDGQIAGLTNTTFDPEATYTGGVAATQEQLSQVNTDLTTAGLNFIGDVGNEVHRDLGQTLSVTGGATGDLTDGNIGVVENDNEDGLEIKLAENINLGEDGSVTTGDTVMDNNGVRVGDNVALGATGLIIDGGPSITIEGIDAGGKKITNVAAGTEDDHAVNLGQLKDVEETAERGWDLASGATGSGEHKGDTGSHNIKPGDTATFVAGDNL